MTVNVRVTACTRTVRVASRAGRPLPGRDLHGEGSGDRRGGQGRPQMRLLVRAQMAVCLRPDQHAGRGVAGLDKEFIDVRLAVGDHHPSGLRTSALGGLYPVEALEPFAAFFFFDRPLLARALLAMLRRVTPPMLDVDQPERDATGRKDQGLMQPQSDRPIDRRADQSQPVGGRMRPSNLTPSCRRPPGPAVPGQRVPGWPDNEGASRVSMVTFSCWNKR
jgi:hypothetical protein